MYILIKNDKTEINENVVTSNASAELPAGWTWIDAKDKLVKKLKAIKEKKRYAEHRKVAYEKHGVTIEALTVASWEKEIEGRPEQAEELQAKRKQIKQKYPKI